MLVTIKKVVETSAGRLLPGAVVDAADWANLPLLIGNGYAAPVLAGEAVPALVVDGGAPLSAGESIGGFLPPVGDETPLSPDAETVTARSRTPRGRR